MCGELCCSLLFPRRCVVCDEILSPEEAEKWIHETCESKLYPITGATCMQCGRPVKKDVDAASKKDAYLEFYNSYEYCDECKSFANSAKYFPNIMKKEKMKEFSAITQGKALYLYRGEIKQTMYRFKYNNKREYAKFFAIQAVEKYGDWMRERKIQAIVPVPMYRKKERRRGYNQAWCFARELSVLTGIPIADKLVNRVKDTPALKGLNRQERKNCLKNAFHEEKNIVQYKHILVVDDIYTTGVTAQAVADVLRKKGISNIYTMSICIGKDM